jgi:hypothetical protein
MPGNVTPAPLQSPIAVLPQSLCTAFVSTRVYPMLSISYHDAAMDRFLIVDTVNPSRWLRTWTLAKRLDSTVHASDSPLYDPSGLTPFDDLYNFYHLTTQGGLYPFYFYDPFDIEFGNAIGSNFDSTGGGTQGRVAVYFRGDWRHSVTLGRVDVPNLLLVECVDVEEYNQPPG